MFALLMSTMIDHHPAQSLVFNRTQGNADIVFKEVIRAVSVVFCLSETSVVTGTPHYRLAHTRSAPDLRRQWCRLVLLILFTKTTGGA